MPQQTTVVIDSQCEEEGSFKGGDGKSNPATAHIEIQEPTKVKFYDSIRTPAGRISKLCDVVQLIKYPPQSPTPPAPLAH
jgi:hypothetical protein